MPTYKFQVPANSKELRGQLFGHLYRKYDCITIDSPEQIEQDRYLAFSHPFDDWVFDAISKDKNLNFFHLDNGYIGNHRHKTPWYYRISYNSLQNTTVRPVPHSRLEFIENDEKLSREWNTDGEYNLLVLPNDSNIFKYLGEDYDTWKQKTILHYKNLDVPCVVREKIGKRRERFRDIINLISNSRKVIVYHSMTAVEALCMGKPIKVLGQSAVEHWQNQINFDRNEMLEHIAWSQFPRSDFASGLAWELTFEYQVGINEATKSV